MDPCREISPAPNELNERNKRTSGLIDIACKEQQAVSTILAEDMVYITLHRILTSGVRSVDDAQRLSEHACFVKFSESAMTSFHSDWLLSCWYNSRFTIIATCQNAPNENNWTPMLNQDACDVGRYHNPGVGHISAIFSSRTILDNLEILASIQTGSKSIK